MTLRHLARRSWLVVLLGVGAGIATWVLVHDDPKIYERTLTFVVLPSPELDPRDVPDAMRGLAQQNSQTSGTIGAAIGSSRALRQASRGIVRGGLSPKYTITSGARPGSDSVVVQLRGPRRDVLARLAPILAADSARWVKARFSSYRLELLETDAPVEPVAPRVFELVGVAAFLACALALGLAYLEAVALRRRDGSGTAVPDRKSDAVVSVIRHDRSRSPEDMSDEGSGLYR